MASWPPSIIHPTASVGTLAFIIFILRESGAAREVASLASSGYERPEVPNFKGFLIHLSVPPPSFPRFISPPPLSGRHRQQGNPPNHASEQSPRQVPLRQ
jgi:hypothetical protein